MPACRALRLLLAALAVATFAGCDNNPFPPPLQKTRPDGSPWLVRYGGLSEDPRSLDPQFAYDSVSRQVLEPIVDCLLEYHPLKTNPFELRPCLLEEIPHGEPGPNGTVVYTCRLKKGIVFHDDPCFPGGKGREVLATDAQFTFQRLADPKVESPILSMIWEYLPGLKKAYEEARKAERFDYSRPIEGIEVLDSHTFRLTLASPYPQINYWMAMHFLAPVPREAVAYYDGKEHDGVQRPLFKFHPVGTGPFQIAEYKRGQRIRMVRNPKYIATTFPTSGWPAEREDFYRPLAGKALPFSDEIMMTIFREAIPVFLLNRQGYLDGMNVGKDSFSSLMTAARELSPEYKKRGLQLYRNTEPSSFYMSLNMQDPLLGSNQKLRQALSASFNAQAYLDIFFNGVPIVAEQILPPGISGYQPEFQNPYGFNLDHARRLIAEAGYPGGIDPRTNLPLEITMDAVADSSDQRQGVEFEQRQFEQLGIRVRIIENDFARMLEKLDTGGFQIASGSGWQADYPDPENFFFLFYSKNVPPTGKNASRYHNADFDRLFEQMANMEDSPERTAIVHKMTALLAEDVPSIHIFHRALFSVHQPWAPRVQGNPMLEGGVKYAMVDPVLREKLRDEWNRPPLWPALLAVGLLAGAGWYGYRVNRQRNI